MRITFVLAVRENEEKVTPLVILKGKDSEIEKKFAFGWSTKPKLGLINVF